MPFFAFSQPIRRAIYTTNAIESLNSTLRRAVRTRGHFPNDWAAPKLLYLALRAVQRITHISCFFPWSDRSSCRWP